MTVLKTDSFLADTARRVKRMAGRSFYLPTDAPHFQVQVGGRWYVCCTIHKNASSSIRAVVEGGVDQRARGRGFNLPVSFSQPPGAKTQ